MAYHPQMDGISKQKHQWVEQFLWLICTNQEDWSNALPVATLVYNNTKNSTTGYAPNQLLISWEPSAILGQSEGVENPLVEKWVDQLQQQQTLAIKALNKATNSNIN